MVEPDNHYVPLSPRLMVQLAAPHTWAASIMPVMFALALSLAHNAAAGSETSALMVCVLLAISILFQSAVNTLNDYFDYAKGTDTLDNQPDATDAVLVYNNVNPKHVLAFALSLVVLAFALGVYCIVVAGWIPLLIGLIGAAIVYLYSGSPLPISYLPLGEVVSGFVMGGLITLASYVCLTTSFAWEVLAMSIPLMIGIGLIMFTNNGCDIDKDIPAGRKTLAVLLGYKRMRIAYKVLVAVWFVSICALVVAYFRPGWPVLAFMLLAVHAPGRALLANPLVPKSRAQALAQCTGLNIMLGSFYAAAVLASALF